MKRYQAVIFDWDGTVVDSTHAIVTAIQLASQDVGLPPPPDDMARWVIGLSLETALYRCVPDLTEALLPAFLDSYRRHYFARDGQLQVFDGMRDVLHGLRGQQVALGVATGKRRQGLDRALDGLSLREYFNVTRCADETASKPDPTMLHEIMDVLQLPPDALLMVGDTTHDVDMAANAGVDCVAVTYGAHDPDTLSRSNPVAMVTSVAGLQAWMAPRVTAA